MQAASDSPSPLPAWPLSVVRGTTTVGSIALPANASLTAAAAAINKSGFGLSATVVRLDSSHFKLQVVSASTGDAAGFQLTSASDTTGSAFTRTTTALNAELALTTGFTATSPSYTFSELLTGVSVTVSEATATGGAATSITVSSDTSALTTGVKAMMDAASTALSTIKKHTDSSQGSAAALKGDWTLTNLASQIRTQVSSAVGGSAPSQAGIRLERDGTIKFDATAFSSAMAADPSLAQKILGGSTGAGTDKVNYTPDDTIAVDGIAARLSVLAEQASDSTSGMITSRANSQDTRAKQLQKQIDAWDLRLSQRQATLTAQFNAMETALGSLQNQATWLTSQLNSLPSWSSSSSKS
jgi:flagellar hook-associated protein 2